MSRILEDYYFFYSAEASQKFGIRGTLLPPCDKNSELQLERVLEGKWEGGALTQTQKTLNCLEVKMKTIEFFGYSVLMAFCGHFIQMESYNMLSFAY